MMKTFKLPKIILLVILASFFLFSCEKEKDSGLPTDGDGNTYDTVVIGTQVWLTENLKTTKYRDGRELQLITDGTEWSQATSAAYCWFNNYPTAYKDTYGALYNWYAGRLDYLCPDGYHVPTKDDWSTLNNTFKESPASVKESFKTVQAGYRDKYGDFWESNGCWWVSSPDYNSSSAYKVENHYFTISPFLKVQGYSVRCVKDN